MEIEFVGNTFSEGISMLGRWIRGPNTSKPHWSTGNQWESTPPEICSPGVSGCLNHIFGARCLASPLIHQNLMEIEFTGKRSCIPVRKHKFSSHLGIDLKISICKNKQDLALGALTHNLWETSTSGVRRNDSFLKERHRLRYQLTLKGDFRIRIVRGWCRLFPWSSFSLDRSLLFGWYHSGYHLSISLRLLFVSVRLFPFFFAIFKQAFDSLLAETSGDDRSRTIASTHPFARSSSRFISHTYVMLGRRKWQLVDGQSWSQLLTTHHDTSELNRRGEQT